MNIVFRFGFEHCSECSEPDRGQSIQLIYLHLLTTNSDDNEVGIRDKSPRKGRRKEMIAEKAAMTTKNGPR